jgi:hypothetical protein
MMLGLYFGNVIAILTTVFVLALIALTVLSVTQHGKISKWGRRILVFVLVGTAISALSATRDAYIMENALFTVSSLQSTVCSIAGGLIFLAGIVSIFVRNQTFRKTSFFVISAFFLVQVLTIEISRVAMLVGGTL